MSAHPALRNAAVTFGIEYARKQFDGRKGHGGSKRVVHRQLSEVEVAAMAGYVFERGAEFVAAHMNLERQRLVAALEKIRDVCHTGTARADLEVRREAFQLAVRELVALGHTPQDWDPNDAERAAAAESHSAMGEYLQRRGG